MATYAYKEQAVIELIAETSSARRELSSVSKVGKQFQLDQMKASLQAQGAIDKESQKTFKNLENSLKKANSTAKQGRDEALAAFQDAATVKPPMPSKAEMEIPEIAQKHKEQLKHMVSNMNEFRDRMKGMDIDVGSGMTMEEDVGAAMGGDDDVRRKGLAVMKQMNNLQQRHLDDLRLTKDAHNESLARQKERLKEEEKELKSSSCCVTLSFIS